MIKGCQRRAVWIHGTDSEWFEEAYFIISEKKDKKKISDADMLSEANRIITESREIPESRGLYLGSEINNAKRDVYLFLRVKWFTLGAVITGCLGVIIGYLIF